MINVAKQEYKRIAGELKRKILIGDFKANEKLLPERKLAEELEVSRITIRSALQELEKEKLIYRCQGAGTFVAEVPAQTIKLDSNSICLVFKKNRGTSISEDPYAMTLLDGINKASIEFAFKVSIMALEAEDTFLNCIEKHPELIPTSKGVIISNDDSFTETYAWLAERGYSVMSLGKPEDTRSIDYSYVDIDNKSGGKTAAEHLLRLGRKNIVHLSASNSIYSSERIEGIALAHKEYGMTFDDSKVKYVKPWDKEEGRRAMLEAIDNNPAIDAVIVYGDMAALGALNALREKGIRVPEDIALISYDDFPWMANIYSPSITAIRQPFDSLAESAAEMLMENMSSVIPTVRIKVFQPSLIIRESCGSFSRKVQES